MLTFVTLTHCSRLRNPRRQKNYSKRFSLKWTLGNSPVRAVVILMRLLRLNNCVFWSAMERALHASKSFIIALALVRGRLSVEEAAQAAHVEVRSQIQKWGEVEDSKFSVRY